MEKDRFEFDELASAWNQADAYMWRLHQLLWFCDKARITDNYDDWYDALESLYAELYPQSHHDEQEELRSLMLNARQWVKNTRKVVNVWNVRDALLSFELRLRQLIKDRGMDLPRAENPAFAMKFSKDF